MGPSRRAPCGKLHFVRMRRPPKGAPRVDCRGLALANRTRDPGFSYGSFVEGNHPRPRPSLVGGGGVAESTGAMLQALTSHTGYICDVNV